VVLDDYVQETEGFTGADIEAVCNRAAILAIREFSQTGEEMGRFVIQPSHFSRAIEMVQANRSKI
jgi:transitional endoplasmic reticulum ATPase